MLALFDHGTPKGLARLLAVIVLTGTTKWSQVRQQADRIAAALASGTPGSYAEVEIPFDSPRRPC